MTKVWRKSVNRYWRYRGNIKLPRESRTDGRTHGRTHARTAAGTDDPKTASAGAYRRRRLKKDTQRQWQRCTETETANGNGRTATKWWKPGISQKPGCMHCVAVTFRQTFGYVSICKASPFFGHYQIMYTACLRQRQMYEEFARNRHMTV